MWIGGQQDSRTEKLDSRGFQDLAHNSTTNRWNRHSSTESWTLTAMSLRPVGGVKPLESPLIENAEVPTVYLMATAASFQNRD